MDAVSMLALVVLASLVGAAGQTVRVVAGLTKEKAHQSAQSNASLAAAAASGALSAIAGSGRPLTAAETQALAQKLVTQLPETRGPGIQSKELLYSLVIAAGIGALAGVLAVVAGAFDPHQLKDDTLLVIFLAGYAGTDFVEAFVAKSYKAPGTA